MEKVNHQNGIYSVLKLGDRVIFNDGTHLIGNGAKRIAIDHLGSFRYSDRYVGVIRKGEIRIFDEDLNLLNTIRRDDIDNESIGIDIFNANNYIMYKTTGVTDAFIYLDNKPVSEVRNFWGKVVNSSYKLTYPQDTFDNPAYFRCSDLQDSKTYFEYQCKPYEQVISNFFVWRESLVFPLVRNEQVWLNVLDIKTGKLAWEIEIANGNFVFDKEKAMFVSVWGNDGEYPDRPRRYQVIDLKDRCVDIDTPKGLGPFFNVDTYSHLRSLYGDRLYFADNRLSFSGQHPNPVSVGRFDVTERAVDLLYEITDSPTSPVSEIVEKGEMLYVRNANNELFTFKLKN